MTGEDGMLPLDFPAAGPAAEVPAAAQRFGRRHRLTGAGLSNVWRFGDLLLDAPSGRLLLRGTNGTGKTTALEALWPYLLDLNSRALGAGKARQTTWASLMRDGAGGARRRTGYAWLTFAVPGDDGEMSYGIRAQFTEGGSPPVRIIPFRVPGRPVTGLPLTSDGRAPLSSDEFTAAVSGVGGQVFTGAGAEDEYVADLAARILRTTAAEARQLAARIRQVRNPNLLAELTAREAREALRDALPGVEPGIITATAEALAETTATRLAFDRDRDSAGILAGFAASWAGHVAAVLRAACDAAEGAAATARRLDSAARDAERDAARAATDHQQAAADAASLDTERIRLEGHIRGLESHDAYKAAGTLTALSEQLRAERETAATTWQSLAAAGGDARRDSTSLDSELSALSDDITAVQQRAARADPAVGGTGPLLTWARTPQAVLTVGDRSADPGPAVAVTSDETPLTATVTAWRAAAAAHTSRAEAADLALADHEPVDAAGIDARDAGQRASDLAGRLDEEERQLRTLTAAAAALAGTLLAGLLEWTRSHPRLASPLDGEDNPAGEPPQDEPESWDTDDLEALRGTEPATLLAAAEDMAGRAAARAASRTAVLRARAAEAARNAAELAATARDLRAEAQRLRAGQLLPLPRPEWAGDGDDTTALGAALDWRPDAGDELRPPIEAALAAAGILGATLTSDGAAATAWQVSPRGPAHPGNLTAVLAADPAHPLAGTAAAVLERIALAHTAADGLPDTALVIGLDGTFRVGLATATPALASDVGSTWPPARHIGARQRREAARARARQLDEQAGEAEDQAGEAEDQAAALHRDADTTLRAARNFPPRATLRDAEAARAAQAGRAVGLATEADEAASHAERLRQQFQRLHAEWADRTRARGLPAAPAELTTVRDASRETSRDLAAAAGELADRLAPRLGRLRATAAAAALRTAGLKDLTGRAQAAAARAGRTQATIDTLRDSEGTAIEEILDQHRQAQDELAGVQDRLSAAVGRRDSLLTEAANLAAQAETTRGKAEEARPEATRQASELSRLLDVPGVTDAVFDGSRPDPATLLADVRARVRTARTVSRKTLRDSYDNARARLAGTWALASGDPLGELDTYVLTHGEESFTPPRAAAHAASLAARAEQALAAAEEKALRDFVVGMLPAAIRTGWVDLHQWVKTVNRKMRAAAASSNLSVQVRIPPAELSENARTVRDISCDVFEGDRTPEQDAAVGRALQALISSAEGDTMAEKVAEAVNIRKWVDVTYDIHRPDGTTAKWGSRTGLSGGERRLVVLAPMLAAIAAGYDQLGATVLRLAALDEVPAEVDEQGREGLARYIAHLDLDLICTSYLWDGAPGAWDGVDAWDLEAAADTTVVGFPMLVRGLIPLPGDPPLPGGLS